MHQNRSLVTCLLRKNGKNVLLSSNSCTFYTKPNLLHGPESSSVKTVNLVKKFATIIAEVMNFHKGFLLAHPVEYCSKDNCTFPTKCVCLYVCSHIIKTTWPNFTKCSNLCMSTVAVAWYSSKYSLWVAHQGGSLQPTVSTAIYDCPVPCSLPPAAPYARILASPMYCMSESNGQEVGFCPEVLGRKCCPEGLCPGFGAGMAF